jgi:hypothetical protein
LVYRNVEVEDEDEEDHDSHVKDVACLREESILHSFETWGRSFELRAVCCCKRTFVIVVCSG